MNVLFRYFFDLLNFIAKKTSYSIPSFFILLALLILFAETKKDDTGCCNYDKYQKSENPDKNPTYHKIYLNELT